MKRIKVVFEVEIFDGEEYGDEVSDSDLSEMLEEKVNQDVISEIGKTIHELVSGECSEKEEVNVTFKDMCFVEVKV